MRLIVFPCYVMWQTIINVFGFINNCSQHRGRSLFISVVWRVFSLHVRCKRFVFRHMSLRRFILLPSLFCSDIAETIVLHNCNSWETYDTCSNMNTLLRYKCWMYDNYMISMRRQYKSRWIGMSSVFVCNVFIVLSYLSWHRPSPPPPALPHTPKTQNKANPKI